MLHSTIQVTTLHKRLITEEVEKNLTYVLDYHHSASWEDEEGEEHGFQPMPSLPKSILLTKLLNHSLTCKALASVMNKSF
jgi:hypothetical protein